VETLLYIFYGLNTQKGELMVYKYNVYERQNKKCHWHWIAVATDLSSAIKWINERRTFNSKNGIKEEMYKVVQL
jgi:hypothetical protein